MIETIVVLQFVAAIALVASALADRRKSQAFEEYSNSHKALTAETLRLIELHVETERQKQDELAAAVYVDTGIWQELHRARDGTLHLHQRVRQDSPAWRRAYDTPGAYLRPDLGGEIVEGAQ